MAPAEPITNAGKTKGQYFSGPSANTSNSVEAIRNTCPVIMNHLASSFLENIPVQLVAKVAIPIGSLSKFQVRILI